MSEKVKAGKQNKEWVVENIEDSQYVVYSDGEDDDPNLVDVDSKHCDGTYFKYNSTCPHLDAAKEVHNKTESEYGLWVDEQIKNIEEGGDVDFESKPNLGSDRL